MKLLRIVIPTKNEEHYLPGLLKSIESQTFKDYEIIVADANSSDKTLQIAKSHKCKIVKGGHPAIGRNNAAKNCKSKIIFFIDSDILLPNPIYLDKAIKEFIEKKIDIAGTLQKPVGTKNPIKNIIYRIFYSIGNLGMILSENTRKPLMQSLMIVKKDVFFDVGGFPEFEFGEDSAFAKRAVAKGYKFKILRKTGRAFISPRRLEKNGLFKMLREYIRLNILRIRGYEFKIEKTRVKYF